MPSTPPSAALPDPGRQQEQSDDRLWQRRKRWTAWLLGVWLVVTFGVSYFARDLGAVVWGWPISFWVAAQGSLLVYLALVVLYARSMGRLDDERDATPRG